MKCPKCGSTHTVPILYGMPAFDDEMVRKLDNRELFLGGCCISDMDPKFHCFNCGKNVGSLPILLSRHGEQDYREIVTGLHFRDGSFFDGYPEVLIKKKSGKIMLDVRPNLQDTATLQRELKQAEWKRLLERLYCNLYLHEWRKRFDNREILDGEQWELHIRLTEGRTRSYSGSNAFPPYWSGLKAAFRPFFRDAGINY